MMRWWILVIVLAVALPAAAQQKKKGKKNAPPPAPAEVEEPQALLPQPSAAEVEAATRRVRQAFAEEYAKRSDADRVALGKRLIEASEQEAENAVLRYAMLYEGGDIAARTGDVQTALQALDQIAAGYEIDELAMRMRVLETTGRALQAEADASAFIDACAQAVRAALKQKDATSVNKLARQAQSAKRRVRQPIPAAQAQRQIDAMRESGRLLQQALLAESMLAKTPDNPRANRTAGLFDCLILRRWDAGLPRLEKSGQEALENIAAFESDRENADILKLGQSWAEVCDQESGLLRSRAARRSVHWLERAMPAIKGLAKLELEQLIGRMYLAAGLPKGYSKLTRAERSQLVRYGDKWFLFVNQKMTYDKATEWAQQRDGSLASVRNAAENSVLTRTFLQNRRMRSGNSFWLGGSDAAREGRWSWQDGTAFRFAKWRRRQPDNAGKNEHFIEMNMQGGWNDRPNGAQQTFIVQWIVEEER